MTPRGHVFLPDCTEKDTKNPEGTVRHKSLSSKQTPIVFTPLSLYSFQPFTYHEPKLSTTTSSNMGWLHSLLISPFKKLWDRLHSGHRRRRGLYILYKDVKSCQCEDVHVLWSILVESQTASTDHLPRQNNAEYC